MLIDIEDRDVTLDGGTLDWIERRLRFALGRFGRQIRRVQVILGDINGHRGGTDKQCRMRLLLVPKGEVVVEDTAESVEAVIAHSADRAARSVARWLVRQREFGNVSAVVRRN